MKKFKVQITLFIGLLIIACVAILPFASGAATSIVDDVFADGNSTNQDLPNNSLRVFKGRGGTTGTTRTDAVGSVRFDIGTAGAEGFWAFFTTPPNSTTPAAPITLAVGDKLTVSGTFSLTGFMTGGQDLRFGVLDSKGNRNTADLTGGFSDATFNGDTGYGLQFYGSGTGNAFILSRRTMITNNNVFGTAGDFTAIPGTAPQRQTLANSTPYVLVYTIERLDATNTKLSVSVTGGSLSGLSYSVTETSSTPNTTFDWFGYRIGGQNYAASVTFTEMKVDYTAAVPVITTQPQPANQTVAIGSNVAFSIGASGNNLSYQWRKNGIALTGNATATTMMLQINNAQETDTGGYDVVVSNSGGSVTSNAVALTVTNGTVEPAPVITQQPADTTVTVNNPATLFVTATGNGLSYQWFKNNVLINGATNSTLNFPSAQVSDAANYNVAVSNSGGTVSSNQAKLTVVSSMTAVSFAPATGSTNICTDSPLSITFSQTPKVGNSGRILVYQSNGTLFDTIDLSAASQTKTIGTANYSFNYYPILINGNTATIYLHKQLLYGQTYYLNIEPGVITDSSNAAFTGFTDQNTFRLTTKNAAPAAGTTTLNVAADGTGNFCTVQGAIDFVPVNNTQRTVITVRRGTYNEIVYIGSSKPLITVRGEDRNQTIVQYANNNNINGAVSGNFRASFGVDAADFNLENITLINTTPKGGSQAETIRTNGGRTTINRATLKSFQDTLLTQNSAFVTDSYVEGDVDFMWGNGSTFYQNSELKALTSNGYYTQIRNPQGKYGNVYVNCRFTAAAGVTGFYLSRIDPGVFPFSQVVLIDSVLDSHIRPEAWLFNNPTSPVTPENYPNIRFWESNSRDTNGSPVNCSSRHPISRNDCFNSLTADELTFYRNPSNIAGFMPQTKLTALVSLGNLNQVYNGSPRAVSVTTDPAGLNVSVTYNGSTVAPTNAGTYNVVATVQDANYQGTASGTLTISGLTATISLSGLNQTFDGSPKRATATTNPANLATQITYNGSTNLPVNVGSYTVVAAINDPNYTGSVSGVLVINPNRLKAFPEAEGAGAFALGGRGGDVYHVTNLNDTGAGSLRNGVTTATGARTIVFDLSGTIYLQSELRINKPFITIAGQTAPGDGITVAGWTTSVTDTHDVIVRYIRFRESNLNCPAVQDDSFNVDRSTDVIVDHVSASWSIDETLSVTESNRVTIQWSMISESLLNSCHVKGAHGYGSLIRYGNGIVTFHHNLIAHHFNRNPRLGDNIGLDFVNNVVYDWGTDAGYSETPEEGSPQLNYVGNYVIAGPSTPSAKRLRAFDGGSTNTLIYQSGNLIDSNVNAIRDGSNTGWAMFTGFYTQRANRFDFPQVRTDEALTAYNRVLTSSGTSSNRDSVDNRIVNDVKTNGGSHIDSQAQVGGFPTLNSLPTVLDTDQDGISDAWEMSHGTDANNPADGALIDESGYSNLENYLSSLAIVPTPIGNDVVVQAGSGVLTFANVTNAGVTTTIPVDPNSFGNPPNGYIILAQAFDISTTSTYSGSIQVCFQVPNVTNGQDFAKLTLLHGETNGNGAITLVDRTSSRNFATRTICANVNSLSPFVLAQNPQIVTAAGVTVGGKVTTAKGRAIPKTIITLTESNGTRRTAVTNAFGNYAFTNIRTGETYIISASSKRYVFADSTKSVSINEDEGGVNFVAE